MKKYKLLFLLLFFCGSSIFSQIQINTDFEGGSGLLLTTGPDNYVQVEAEFVLDDTRNFNFYCELTGLDSSQALQFDLEAEFVSNYFFYSYDALDWFRTDASVNGISMIPLSGNTSVYVATFVPYLYSDLQNFLMSLESQELPFLEIKELAMSPQGVRVDILTISDPCVPDIDKKTVWILSRQHAAEIPVSHLTEGLMEVLCASDAQMQRLRKEAIINIVPMMDVDMVINGGTGKDQNPVDFNRDWIDPTHNSHWAAVQEVKQLMQDQENELSLLLDMHTFAPGEAANVQIAVNEANQLLFTENFNKRIELNGGLNYEIVPFNDLNTATAQDYAYVYHPSANLLSLTPETAFDLAPDGSFWTPEKLLEQGRAYGRGISDYINGLDRPSEQVVENDDASSTAQGTWNTSTNFPGFSGVDYQFAEPGADAVFTFNLIPDATALYGISTHYSSDANRADNVSYQLNHLSDSRDYLINQKILGTRWRHLDTMTLREGNEVSLSLFAANTNGFVIADAFRIYPINTCVTSALIEPDVTEKVDITVYPNPTRDNLKVQSALVIKRITLLDLTGKEIISHIGNVRGLTIDLSHLLPGSYILKTEFQDHIELTRVVKL